MSPAPAWIVERSFTAASAFMDQEIAGMFSQPLQILLVMLAGPMNRQGRAVIDYLMEEARVLRELLGQK